MPNRCASLSGNWMTLQASWAMRLPRGKENPLTLTPRLPANNRPRERRAKLRKLKRAMNNPSNRESLRDRDAPETLKRLHQVKPVRNPGKPQSRLLPRRATKGLRSRVPAANPVTKPSQALNPETSRADRSNQPTPKAQGGAGPNAARALGPPCKPDLL